MSIDDPIIVRYSERHEYWYLTQGRETFYNEDNQLIYFDNKDDAVRYSMKILGKEPIDEPTK